ncbi:hypothetical protein [Haloplanus natans]|uniref:hypothetical protein n=1 Tax=Haloplanus natans TaxID=376171 RepID=UPI0006781931|nr:hypothetical protein [Haloplanus natans]
MADSSPDIEFTTILYGVVASNALFRLTPAVDIRNAMLLFAFGILAADWFEYRLSAAAVPDTVGADLRQFGLDMLILVVWAFLPVLPATALPTYLAVVAVFVVLQGVWDAALLETPPTRGIHTRAEWELAVGYGALLGASVLVPVSRPALFVAGVALFLGPKGLAWRTLYRRAKRDGATGRI